MVMKWFTRDYVDGGLDDDEWSRRRADYADHLNSIRADLSDGAEELIATVNLRDAQVHGWNIEDQAFRLRVLAGDLQHGYEQLTLVYDDAELVGATTDDLARWRLTEAGVELVEDEIDLGRDDRYEHRLLVSPEGEFGVRFRSVQVTREPAASSQRR